MSGRSKMSLLWAGVALTLACLMAPPRPVPAQEANDRISIHDLKRKMDRKEKIVIVDARAGNAYLGSQVRIKGAIHLTLSDLESRMNELPRRAEIIIYCT